jgi:hypothetical protein
MTMSKANIAARYNTIRSAHASLSHEFMTYGRSPEVSTTAFCAQPPNLRLTSLMDMDLAITRSLVRRPRLLSGSCPSAHAFARRFLQTLPHGNAFALRYPSPPSGWEKTSTSKLSYMLGTREPPSPKGEGFGHRLKSTKGLALHAGLF